MRPSSGVGRLSRMLTRCGVGLWIVTALALSPGDGRAATGAHTGEQPAAVTQPVPAPAPAAGSTVTFTVLAAPTPAPSQPPATPRPAPGAGLPVTGTVVLALVAMGALLVVAGTVLRQLDRAAGPGRRGTPGRR
jgi:hypothetical protein